MKIFALPSVDMIVPSVPFHLCPGKTNRTASPTAKGSLEPSGISGQLTGSTGRQSCLPTQNQLTPSKQIRTL
jgi:hypothetical protein